jgi:hypothetical protein
MLGPGWTEVVALVAAFVVAVLATPAGISGAVLLLPFQVSVLGTPSPAVTPTNLLYNVVATPGALYRYWRQGQTGGRLALLLIAGTLPGVVGGSVIRVELLPGASLPGREQRALDRIGHRLAAEDPGLGLRLALFTRLTRHEAMPATEQVPGRLGRPRRISGSPPVNRTSVMPSRRTATQISRATSSSVSSAGPGSQSRPSAGMQ